MNRGEVPFKGIIPDTGCAHDSTGGLVHYHAYCRYTGTQPRIDTSRRVFCRFGKGSAWSIGFAKIKFPFRERYLSFNLSIVLTQCEILLSHGDMNRLGITYDNIERVMKHPKSGISVPVTVVDDTPFIQWDPIRDDPIQYREQQLQNRKNTAESNSNEPLSLHNRTTQNLPTMQKRPRQDGSTTFQQPPKSFSATRRNLIRLNSKNEQSTRQASRLKSEQWF